MIAYHPALGGQRPAMNRQTARQADQASWRGWKAAGGLSRTPWLSTDTMPTRNSDQPARGPSRTELGEQHPAVVQHELGRASSGRSR